MATAVFLDTTIQIARFVGAPQFKRKITQQLCCADLTVTSLVVRQEWKRRLLTDARYVLDILRRKNLDVGATIRQINRKLVGSSHNKRKLSICLNIIATATDGTHEITDAGERLENLLILLLEDGLSLFDHNVMHVIEDSGCGCALVDVSKNTVDDIYDIGPQHCHTAPNACNISMFFDKARSQIIAIAEHLKSVQDQTAELRKGMEFIEAFLSGSLVPTSQSPCLTIGDMAIALESSGIPVFYTTNYRESEHLCRALKQNLVVGSDDETPDTCYPHSLRRPMS